MISKQVTVKLQTAKVFIFEEKPKNFRSMKIIKFLHNSITFMWVSLNEMWEVDYSICCCRRGNNKQTVEKPLKNKKESSKLEEKNKNKTLIKKISRHRHSSERMFNIWSWFKQWYKCEGECVLNTRLISKVTRRKWISF